MLASSGAGTTVREPNLAHDGGMYAAAAPTLSDDGNKARNMMARCTANALGGYQFSQSFNTAMGDTGDHGEHHSRDARWVFS